MITRRDFLARLGAGVATVLAPDSPLPRMRSVLRQAATAAIGSSNMALVLRYFAGNQERFRIQINEKALFPTASCFKAWLPTYYYTLMPSDTWDDAPGSVPYSVVVYSNNVRTGELMAQVGEQQLFGNALEKYNDFLYTQVGMLHGLNTWNWPGNPLIGLEDTRFGGRMVYVNAVPHAIGNVTTADDLARGYTYLLGQSLRPDEEALEVQAAVRTLQLLSIPDDTGYRSPIERVIGPEIYTGKDGILPTDATTAGRVVNDAGILPVRNGVYVIAFLSVGESEYRAMQALRAILDAVEDVTPMR